MHAELYSDGIDEITVSGTVVRVDRRTKKVQWPTGSASRIPCGLSFAGQWRV
jgi:hypothetical protein